MAHIHTEPGQHDLVVSMYIIRTDFDQPKLMLHWHKKLNCWLQFGGHVELDENPWQAVEHELLEETGYELSQLKLLQPAMRLSKVEGVAMHPQPIGVNTHPITDDHSHIGIDYAFVTSEEPKHGRAEGESSRFWLATRDEIAGLDGDGIRPGMKEICLYVLDEILPSWERVLANKA